MNKIIHQLLQSFLMICFLCLPNQVWAAGDYPAAIAITMVSTMIGPAVCFFYILGCFRSIFANIICLLGLFLPTAIVIAHYQTTDVTQHAPIMSYIPTLLIISSVSGIFFYLGRLFIKKIPLFKMHIRQMIIYNGWLICLFFTSFISLGYFPEKYSWLVFLFHGTAIIAPLIYIVKRARSQI